jgi:hypothetical protein
MQFYPTNMNSLLHLKHGLIRFYSQISQKSSKSESIARRWQSAVGYILQREVFRLKHDRAAVVF